MGILGRERRQPMSALARSVAERVGAQGLDTSYCADMAHDPDSNYMRGQHIMGSLLSPFYFSFLDARGMDNLKTGRPTMMFANHLSQADYMAVWMACMNSGVPVPRFVASKTLDHPEIMGLFGLNFRKDGCIFVDRDLLNNGMGHAAKAAYHATLKETFRHVFEQNGSIFVFPEGGRVYRPDEEPCKNMKRPVFKMLEDFHREGMDIDVACLACGYDTRVEERAFPILDMCRKRDSVTKIVGYYSADALAFVTWPIRRLVPPTRDGCYVVAGNPRPMGDIIGGVKSGEGWQRLSGHVGEEIRGLYGQLQRRKANAA